MVGAVREAGADYYRYKDSSGTVCITNKLDAVPPRYRATMRVIPEERKDPALRQQGGDTSAPTAEPVVQQGDQHAAAPSQPTSRFGQLAARFPWLVPLAIVVGIVAGFLVVARLAELLPSKLLARLLYLAFFLGICVFSYKAYADHAVTSYFSIKNKVLRMFKKANEREGLQMGEKPAETAKEQPGDQ